MSEPAKKSSVTDNQERRSEFSPSVTNCVTDKQDPRSGILRRVTPQWCGACNRDLAPDEKIVLGVGDGYVRYVPGRNEGVNGYCLPCSVNLRPRRERFYEFNCHYCARRVISYYFMSAGDMRQFCSSSCRNRFYRKAPEILNCAVCRKPFTPKRADAKHCSLACKQKAYRQRHSGAGPRKNGDTSTKARVEIVRLKPNTEGI
jgi:hypothetical protein